MAKKSEKTNALRLLDKLKIPYEAHSYPCEEFTGGEDVARQLGLDPADVCKTLVTVGKNWRALCVRAAGDGGAG